MDSPLLPQTRTSQALFTNAHVYRDDVRGEPLIVSGSRLYEIDERVSEPPLDKYCLVGQTVCAFATATNDERDEELVATYRDFNGQYKDVYLDRDDLPDEIVVVEEMDRDEEFPTSEGKVPLSPAEAEDGGSGGYDGA